MADLPRPTYLATKAPATDRTVTGPSWVQAVERRDAMLAHREAKLDGPSGDGVIGQVLDGDRGPAAPGGRGERDECDGERRAQGTSEHRLPPVV